ncbi:MAG: glycosyltransferase [Acidobacteriota bacterium]|nr:MAG: glycosyltransferase [Acidobacteriota bacterium]
MKPLVSTIIPTLLPERFESLCKAIRSVLDQSYPRVEAIVVADGPGATHVEKLSEKFPGGRVRVARRDRRGGPGAARNAGAGAAQGEYLAFLDDDDEWLPQKLEVQMAIARERPDAAFLFSDAYVIKETGTTTFFEGAEFSGSPTLEALCRRDFVLCATALVKRAIFEEVGGLDGSEELLGADDADLWGRILYRGHPAAYSPLPLVRYNYRSNGYSESAEFFQHLQNLLKKRMRLFSDRPECTALLKDYLFRMTCGEGNKHLRDGRIEKASACFGRAASLRFSPTRNYSGEFHEGAYCFLLSGRRAEARRFLCRSMRLRPFYLKNYLYWVFTCLPAGGYRALRNLKRRLFGRSEKTE